MAITNHDRVGKGLEALRQGLIPCVQREAMDLRASPLSSVPYPLRRV